ncbi:MAG: hypothetical protein Q9213_003567 [Squamulea squamosa]
MPRAASHFCLYRGSTRSSSLSKFQLSWGPDHKRLSRFYHEYLQRWSPYTLHTQRRNSGLTPPSNYQTHTAIQPFIQDPKGEQDASMTSSNLSSTPPSSPPSASPLTNTLSDIFSDSPPASPFSTTNTHPAEPSDIPRLRGIHSTEGYREGVSYAKHQAAQPGFDEAYPLGAILGLRVGYILGVLEGLFRACGVTKGQVSGNGRSDVTKEEAQMFTELLAQARDELKIENLCGEEYWRNDGIWAYEVRGKMGEEDITFWDVADQHPVILKWLDKVRDEVRKLGIEYAEDGFSGVGEGEGRARLENLIEVGARGL